MAKIFYKYPNLFNKNGKRIPGAISDRVPISRVSSNNPADKDAENRCQVVDEIEKLVKEGIAIEDACNSMVEKYKGNFKYLPQNELANIFNNWYKGRIKQNNRKTEGKTW